MAEPWAPAGTFDPALRMCSAWSPIPYEPIKNRLLPLWLTGAMEVFDPLPRPHPQTMTPKRTELWIWIASWKQGDFFPWNSVGPSHYRLRSKGLGYFPRSQSLDPGNRRVSGCSPWGLVPGGRLVQLLHHIQNALRRAQKFKERGKVPDAPKDHNSRHCFLSPLNLTF